MHAIPMHLFLFSLPASLLGLLHLHELDLSNNGLHFVKYGVLEDLYFLAKLKLGGNPWVCDYRWVLQLKCLKSFFFFSFRQMQIIIKNWLHFFQHPLHGVLAAAAPRGETLWPAVSLPSWTYWGECGGVCALLQQRVSKGQTAQQNWSRPNGPRAMEHTNGSAGRAGGGAGAEPLESAAEIPDHQAVLTQEKSWLKIWL